MVQLTEAEVLKVITRLKHAGLNYKPVQDELLDHICCQVEFGMTEGQAFETALDAAFDAYKEDEFKEIQQQILKPKSFFMYQLPLFIGSFLFLLISSYILVSPAIHEAEEDQTVEYDLPYNPEDVYESVFDNPVAVYASAEMDNDPPSAVPLNEKYKISSGFGMRMHPVLKVKKRHFGVDLVAPMGTAVHATADGEVIKVSYHKGYGNHIVIKHDDVYESLYAQLSETKVEVGQKVKKGDIIGAVGSSGMSTAPHLHYEVIENGSRVDPKSFFTP
jgi:murein DD-endopeptidase MepM/ murein hydrolase activator NlpD